MSSSHPVVSGRTPETLPVLVSYVDPELRFRFANQAFERWFGAAPQSLTGRSLPDFFGRAKYGELEAAFQSALAGRQVAHSTDFTDGRGQMVFGQMVLVPQMTAEGRAAGIYCLITDLSAVQRSQKALQQSEALYHSLVDQLPMCLLRKDREGRFTFCNRQCLEFIGRTADEVIGRTDYDLFEPDVARKFREDDLRVQAAGTLMEAVERNQVEGEKPHWVQFFKSPVFDAAGQVAGVQVLFWDVTARHLAEESARESTALKRAIFDSALDCIVLIDQQGLIIDINRSVERVFGWSRNELIGTSIDDTLFPESIKQRQQSNRDRYDEESEEGSLVGKRVEIPARRRDGRVFHVEMAMQPIPYDGRTVFAMFLHDIEERRAARREIEQKNRDLETLLYVTSHDLREPLRAIRSFSQLLTDRVQSRLDESEAGFLRRIIDGADRLNQLLEDVLTLSRAQRAGGGTEPVDSRLVVMDAIRELDVRINETGARIVVADPLPAIHVDPRWLRQSVFNLLVNAMKFRNEGQAPEIEIVPYQVRPGDGDVTGLVVMDRGPGVPAEHSERVFQLFQRAVGRKVEGTGAGLAIVRQVSNRYGGHAWYEPRPGGGSQFFITFSSGAVSRPE